MRSILIVSLICLAVAVAEPPRRNSKFSRQFQRVEAAPYEPSGWRPSGPSFRIPGEQESVPHTVYGPPPQEYGPPPQEYGPPPQEYGPPPAQSTTETIELTTTTEVPTTTENSIEAETIQPIDGQDTGRLTKGQDQGAYYIYHPNGVLQRVVYNTNDDIRNMQYSARLKYETVEPIRGPIYTYDKDNLILRKL